jgi:hypothetical protein
MMKRKYFCSHPTHRPPRVMIPDEPPILSGEGRLTTFLSTDNIGWTPFRSILFPCSRSAPVLALLCLIGAGGLSFVSFLPKCCQPTVSGGPLLLSHFTLLFPSPLLFYPQMILVFIHVISPLALLVPFHNSIPHGDREWADLLKATHLKACALARRG